jgi:hypothetical protein
MLVQSSGKSSISNIKISNEDGGIFCGVECCDASAGLLENPKRCKCMLGFVSSSGNGRFLENGDFCESCEVTPNQCGFDGDSCFDGGDCWNDNCDTPNDVCISSVSSNDRTYFACPILDLIFLFMAGI